MRLIAPLLALFLCLPVLALAADAPTDAPADDAVAPAPVAPPLVGYKKGFFIKSPDGAFGLTIGGRMQFRLMWENEPGDDGRSNEVSFSVPRARLKLKGRMFDGLVSLALQLDFAKGTFAPKDVYADFRVVPDHLWITVGQFKKPFDRDLISSSSGMQFPERPITEKYFKAGRDVGLMLHNNFKKAKPMQWAVALVNGTSEKASTSGGVTVDLATGEGSIDGTKTTNIPSVLKPMLVARVGFVVGDINPYTHAEPGKKVAGFAMGASGMLTFDADKSGEGAARAQLDWLVRIGGFTGLGGFWLGSLQTGDGWDEQEFDAFAASAQVGYAILGKVEPAVRYAVIAIGGDGNDRQEVSAVVAWYIRGHNIKLALDGSALIDETATGIENSWRSRMNLELHF